jgi:DNA adenine methylase
MGDFDIPKFVKWAGGKTQLLDQFIPMFPEKFEKYFEPFVGSGAVAFYVLQNYNPKEVVLSDINEELINAFNIIKTDVENLISKLKEHKENHTSNAKEYYYEIRARNPEEMSNLDRAARFIYLNKTCFNGLYRVNSKNKFNVPIGSYKNPDVTQEDKLRKVSIILKDVKIKVMSFEKVLELANKNDFVYFDPPYYPLKRSSFTTYTKNNFLEDEQKLLADVFAKLDKRGCFVMLSNSDTDFIKEIYSNYDVSFVKARRLINSNANGRGKINEVVVRNY